MKSFYSSLVINHKKFPNIHQVFRPRFNKEFFKRLTSNLEHAEALIEKRCKRIEPRLTRDDLLYLKEHSPKLIQSMNQLKSMLDDQNDDKKPECDRLQDKIREIEDEIMPRVVRMPNRVRKSVPEQEVTVEELKSDFMLKEGLSKVLSHTKLSYINNCYTKSVVGPNSHYYFGIGAKLQQGLTDFFTHEYEKADFIPISGLCLNKSAVVEASNSRCTKNYMTDPCRILHNEPKPTTVHLTEASRESLLGFITTIGTITSVNPLRLMCSGASYQNGSEWFDPDTTKVSQFDTVHLLSFAPSIEPYSVKEFDQVRELVWNTYKKIGLPSRLVHCSTDTMRANEYDAYRIDVWLPSQHDWIPTGRVSHYLDFCTVRFGLKRGHVIDSSTFSGPALAAAIVENNQSKTGRFIIPSVIREHIIALTESEQKEYFRTNPIQTASGIGSSVLHNLEQRRHFKRDYEFSHSRKAFDRGPNYRRRVSRIGLSGMIALSFLVDWTEMWILYVPLWLKRPLYDYIYRPCRRLFWFLTYPNGHPWPKDETFDEMDKSIYNETTHQRRKRAFYKYDLERNPEARKVYSRLKEISDKEMDESKK